MKQVSNLLKFIRKNFNILLSLSIGVACVFILLKKPAQIYPVTKSRVINKNIKGKERVIETHTEKIILDKKLINLLNGKIETLESKLDSVRRIKDTVQIIQIQDTLISVLYKKIDLKDSIISSQDTIITAQRYIINSKDTIITTQAFDLKRVKRQRNLSLLANGVLTGILIFK